MGVNLGDDYYHRPCAVYLTGKYPTPLNLYGQTLVSGLSWPRSRTILDETSAEAKRAVGPEQFSAWN